MTREELKAYRAKLSRAEEIEAELTILERTTADPSMIATAANAMFDGYGDIMSAAKVKTLLKLGIETRIQQLEQELADITVGEVAKAKAEPPKRKPWCCECTEAFEDDGENIYCPKCRESLPFLVKRDPCQPIVMVPMPVSTPTITCEPEPLIAGGVQ